MFTFSAILLMIHSITILASGQPTAIVRTTSGRVQGRISRTHVNSMKYAAFAGIRYGKAPVGYLRFKPPVPVEPWTETLQATSPGNECPQIDEITQSVKGSEDCLFLSIYTTVTKLRAIPAKLKSVMVWIHGGSFISGSQWDTRFYADYLLERDVVYVAINYRLGALGFLSLNHRNATGNAGLKDQVLALKWIKANIKKFGGNPKNVTIFGESAGAVSVGFHVLSEASAGLFHGAISMSGTPLVPWGFTHPESAVSRAWTLGSSIGDDSLNKDILLETLYATSMELLVLKATDVGPLTPFTPTLEDARIATDVFISECTINKYNTGNFNKVPQLLGFTEQETASFLGHAFSSITDLIPHFGGTFIDLAVNTTMDLYCEAPIDTTQRLLVSNNDGKPIYYYRVTFAMNNSLHNIDQNIQFVAADNTDDLAYVFYIPHANYNHNLSDPTALTNYRVSTMWTNFAKYGNPTPDWINEYPLGVTWPESGCEGKVLNIGNDLTVESRPINWIKELIEIWGYSSLGTITGCTSRTSMPTCNKILSSTRSVKIPIFGNAPSSSSVGLTRS